MVVSDVSSTVWLTQFYSKKLAIALDFHNYLISNDLKGYPNIIYFDNYKDISKFNFSKFVNKKSFNSDLKSNDVPLLNDSILT